MSDELTEKQADSTVELLDEVWAAIDAGEDYEDVPAQEYLDEWPLEVVWEKGEPFAVVLGTGGPHVEITGGGRSSGSGYELHVYWGTGHSIRRGDSITRTGAYFRELVEGMG